jgi:hypothetical protein
LADEIGRVVRNYKFRHPKTTNDQVRDALDLVGRDYPLPWPEADVP